MTRTDATSERGAFKPPPKFFTVKGFQGDVPIEHVRSKLRQVVAALNRADTQNQHRHFRFTDDEVSALAFFGLDCGRGSRQSWATTMDVPTAQPASAHDSANLVATEIEDTLTSLSGASSSQTKAGEDLSAVRDEGSIAPPCGLTTRLARTELERRSEDFPAMALQDEHTGNSASADIIQNAPANDVPACSISGLDADDTDEFSKQPHIDPMSQQALPHGSPLKHSPPLLSRAVTAARKVNRSLYAQPDFEHVQHEFDANGLSLKTLWHQYCQSHPNKRTYEYSQFCNRFNNWVASQASTALSQGP